MIPSIANLVVKPTVLGASAQFDCAACQSRRLFQNLARSRAVLVGGYYWVHVTCNVPFKRHLSTPLHVTPFDPFFFCFPTEYIDCTLLRAPFSPELLRAVPVCSRLHGSSFVFFTRARSLFLCSELTWSAHKPGTHKKESRARVWPLLMYLLFLGCLLWQFLHSEHFTNLHESCDMMDAGATPTMNPAMIQHSAMSHVTWWMREQHQR